MFFTRAKRSVQLRFVHTFGYRHLYILLFLAVLLPCSSRAQVKNKKADSLERELLTVKTDSDRAKLCFRIGYYYEMDDALDMAKGYAWRCISASQAAHLPYREGLGNYLLSDIYARTGQSDSTFLHAQKAVALFDIAAKKTIYYPLSISNMAIYYVENDNNAEALKLAQRELEVSEAINDTSSIANSYNLFSGIYQNIKNYPKAIEYSEKAVALKKKTGTMYNLANMLLNLAELYVHVEKYKAAYPLLMEGLYYSRITRKTDNEATAYMALGNYFEETHQYDSAILYLDKARAMDAVQQEPNFVVNLQNCYANVYAQMKNYTAAMDWVNKGIQTADGFNSTRNKVPMLLLKADILFKMNDYKGALETYKAYHTLSDSFEGTESKTKVAELEKKYETVKKDREITFLDSLNKLNGFKLQQQQQLYTLIQNEAVLNGEKLRNEVLLKEALESKNLLVQQQLSDETALKNVITGENELKKKQLSQQLRLYASLKKEDELKQKDLKNERNIRYLLLSGVAVLLTAGTLIMMQYTRQRRATKTIKQQSDKLTLLMKELHHRVKNNLQIVSSLLSLQSFRMHDQSAAAAVRDGQHRIEAMSLIHQRLYTKDDITQVNIREFITDISESLMSAYGYHRDDFDLRLKIENELLDVEQAIPLSLIINELITNALKYAYPDVPHPELHITLSKEEKEIRLVIADNGKGIDMEVWKRPGGSFGKELVQTFVRQLNGMLSIATDKGTSFTLTIPVAVKAA